MVLTKKNKSARNNVLFILLEILCAVLFFCTVVRMYRIVGDYKKASREYEVLAESVVKEEKKPVFTEETEKREEYILDLPYDYEVAEYDVDLETVKMKNSDTVGWIILPDSKINYPIVKSKDNKEYLTTTFEGQTANSGAIFLSMYCDDNFSNQNTVIYGHNMKNGSMFRALNHMTDKEYFWRHHIFYMDIGNGVEPYEVISCYQTIETDPIPWQLSFQSQESYETWLKSISERCAYDCVDYDVNKTTITLSTCRGQSGGTGRFVVHLQKK